MCLTILYGFLVDKLEFEVLEIYIIFSDSSHDFNSGTGEINFNWDMPDHRMGVCCCSINGKEQGSHERTTLWLEKVKTKAVADGTKQD